jgi:2-oxoglutaroyl-CoA hydrolase
MTESLTPKRHEILNELDGFRVEIDPDKQRADIILDRPPLNVIHMPQRDQLRLVFEELDHDDRVRVIVVRAEGEHFSSGGYIKGFMESSPEKVSRLADNIAAPTRCHKPVIAANRGYCFGVGFELSLACDFRICTDTSLYALPEQRIGQIPGSGGSIRLLHMIGMQRTKDMTFRSRRVTGQEAKEWGMVLDCVPDAELEAATDKLVEELKFFSPLAQRTIKGVLNAAQNMTVEGGIELEGNAYGRLRMSEDFKEGVAAFHEKRRANFKGE